MSTRPNSRLRIQAMRLCRLLRSGLVHKAQPCLGRSDGPQFQALLFC